MTQPTKKIRVTMTGSDAHTAYVALPGHEMKPGIVSCSIRLDDLIKDYHGPQINLDFDRNKRLIGIEVLVFGEE